MVYSTGNYTQYLVIIYNGRESEKEYIYIYIHICTTESLCCIPGTNSIINQLYLNKRKKNSIALPLVWRLKCEETVCTQGL